MRDRCAAVSRWFARVFALLAVVAMVSGCDGPATLVLPSWQLQLPTGAPPTRLELPARIEDLLPHERCVFRLRADVVLPKNMQGRALAVSIPMLRALATLRVNEHDVAATRDPLSAVYRASGPHRWYIPAELTITGAVSLEITVRHEWEQSAWLDTAPRLTGADDSDPSTRWAQVFAEVLTMFAAGMLVATGFASLVLFLLDRRNKGFAGLAVTAFTVSYYLLFEAGWTQVFGAQIDVQLLGICVVSGAMSQIFMLHSNFSLSPPNRWLVVAWAACVMTAILSSNPFLSSIVIGRVSIAFIAACVGYLLAICVRAYRAPIPAPTSMINFVAFSAFGICLVPTGCHWIGLRTESVVAVQSAVVGVLLYAVMQFYALSFMHVRALRTSEGRQGEIAVLNQELRRQLTERSERLSEALARLGSSGVVRELSAGTIVDGRYRIVRELGKGGMGTAYQVERVADGVAFAIKVLGEVSDARIMARFAREAHIAARIQHPNLVSIIDIGFASSGFMYLVMEYVDGETLEARRDRFGDVAWALGILRGVAEGLAALHAEGVVHRDIKPANILLTQGELPKIADFGVSFLLDDPDAEASLAGEARTSSRDPVSDADTVILEDMGSAGAKLTKHGDVVGTPAYMAPEVVGHAAAGSAADVFGFGVMAFELLAGRRPFATPPAVALLRHIEPSASLRLHEVRPSLPMELATLIQDAMDFAPERRPSAAALARALAVQHP